MTFLRPNRGKRGYAAAPLPVLDRCAICGPGRLANGRKSKHCGYRCGEWPRWSRSLPLVVASLLWLRLLGVRGVIADWAVRGIRLVSAMP
jgi:hypothetical protein